MSKLYKDILIELLWLTAVLVAVLLIAGFVFQVNLLNGTLDIHLHDTYFVVSKTMIFIPLFLLAAFIFFLIRAIRFRFFKSILNTITILSGILLLVFIQFVIREVIKLSPAFGWTLFPPLSALGDYPETPKLSPLVFYITNSLMALQLIIIIALLYASFQWGRKKQKGI